MNMNVNIGVWTKIQVVGNEHEIMIGMRMGMEIAIGIQAWWNCKQWHKGEGEMGTGINEWDRKSMKVKWW